MTNDEEMRFIRRVDRPAKKTHGWEVRMERMGQKVSLMHSDLKYGGRDKARLAAIAFRNQLLAEHDTPEYKKWVHEQKGRREVHETQVKGVTLRDDWVAKWVNANGSEGSRSFSVRLHGDEEARRMAEEARKAAMLEGARARGDDMKGVTRETFWCARQVQEDGSIKETQFSVRQYGERARALAEATVTLQERASHKSGRAA